MRLYFTLIMALVLVAAGAAAAGNAGTGPGQPPPPKVWANLRCSSGQPVHTLGPGSTCGAVAVTDNQLLLAEIHEGGVYLSELDSQTATARWTVPIAAAVPGRERKRVQLAVVRDRAWISWLEPGDSTGAGGSGLLTVSTMELGVRQPEAPTTVAETRAAAAGSHTQQLWLAWLGAAETGSVSLSAGVPGSSYLTSWTPSAPGRPTDLALGDLGADLFLAVLMREPQRTTLWLAQYDGRRVYGVRKLHQANDLASPAVCMLQDRILLLYTEFSQAGAGDLQLTVTNTLGSEVVSSPYVADGRLNLVPSLAARNRTAFAVYNVWQSGTNLGLFLAEIESVI